MRDGWYYKHGGLTLGPVTLPGLQNLADKGELSPTDLIWPVGKDPRSAIEAQRAVTFPSGESSDPPSSAKPATPPKRVAQKPTRKTRATNAPAGSMPDWVAGLPDAEPAADQPAASSSSLPDWLEDVRQAQENPPKSQE
jgi:hypothetical protein